jgi:threonine/homoserine/homoserine lactone efflux protein
VELFSKGLVLGFSIAAPVGPIGLLCIRRSLADGTMAGVVTGLGAATADAMYGCIAGFGLTAISDMLVHQRFWFGLFGGGFLCYLGFRIMVSRPATDSTEIGAMGLIPAYASTLLLTLANPLTILSFAAVFAGFGLGSVAGRDYSAACKLVAGVFSGSALWWLLLSSAVGVVRMKFGSSLMLWTNRVSGGIILVLGLYAILRVCLG